MSKYFLDSFVKDLREQNGLTQLQFAEKLGVGFSTLKMAELGTTSIPQKDFLSALAKYCKTNEDEILKYVLYYDYLDYLKINKDANALALYTCHLYNNGFRLVDPFMFLKSNAGKFGFNVYKFDEDHFISTLLPAKLEKPNKDLEIENFLGIGTCVKKGNNPIKLIISVISKDLVFADVKNNPNEYLICAETIIRSISSLYPEFDYTNTKISFVYSDGKDEHKIYLKEKLLTNNIDKRSNFNFVYVNSAKNTFDVLYYR